MAKKDSRRAVNPDAVAVPPALEALLRGAAAPRCAGCEARESELQFLRQKVNNLEEKLLSLVPEAMDRYHRLRMTETAQLRPEVMDGLAPLSDVVPDQDGGFGEFLDGFMPGQMPAQRGRK